VPNSKKKSTFLSKRTLAVTDLSVGRPKISVFVWAKIKEFIEKKRRLVNAIFEIKCIKRVLYLKKNI
jgi:hypothetical protein